MGARIRFIRVRVRFIGLGFRVRFIGVRVSAQQRVVHPGVRLLLRATTLQQNG